MRILKLTVILSIAVVCCTTQTDQPQAESSQTHQSGVADAASASLIAEVEEAMGGRRAYDALETIKWTFFGFRHLIWNTHTGDVRIESPRDSTIYLWNAQTKSGRVKVGDEEITHPDSLQKKLTQAEGIWINDSYWLVMPFKLRDPGVQVEHLGSDTTQMGENAQVMALTFDEVGNTPQNKYHVWVTEHDKLIKQWSFYPNATDAEPRAVWRWDNYQGVGPEGRTRLSFDRSDETGPSNVQTAAAVDPQIFAQWDAQDLIQEAFKEM